MACCQGSHSMREYYAKTMKKGVKGHFPQNFVLKEVEK